MLPALLAQATQGVDIGTIPVEGQVLFIWVLLLGLAIKINALNNTHQQAENLHVFGLATLLLSSAGGDAIAPGSLDAMPLARSDNTVIQMPWPRTRS